MARGLFLILAMVLAVPVAVSAEKLSLSSKSRVGLLRSQLEVLDRRAANQDSASIRLQPPRAVVPGTPQALKDTGALGSPYYQSARAAAKTNNIPEDLFLRLIQQESGWNPAAVSNKGAIGLTQLMPQTARLLRVDARAPAENLHGGARYLRMMYDRFGTWRLALAAYNAGPEAVVRYDGIPPFTETRNYVQIILPTP